MMRGKIAFLGLLFTMLCAISLNGQMAKYTLDTNKINLGEPFTLRLEYAGSIAVDWPAMEKIFPEELELIKKTGVLRSVGEKGDSISFREYQMTAWDSGYFVIKPATFFKKDTKEVLAETKAVLVEATFPDVQLAEEIKDIDAPMAYDPTFWELLREYRKAVTVILIVVVFVTGIMIYILTRKKKEVKIKAPKMIVPPDVQAFKALDDLAKKEMWQKGNLKGYHSELNSILRKYISRRYGFMAMEMVSDEIIYTLNSMAVSQDLIEHLKETFEIADMVKFAKADAMDDENIRCMTLIRQFVEKTRIKPLESNSNNQNSVSA